MSRLIYILSLQYLMRPRKNPLLLASLVIASLLALQCISVMMRHDLDTVTSQTESQSMMEVFLSGRIRRTTASDSVAILLLPSSPLQLQPSSSFHFPRKVKLKSTKPHYNNIKVKHLDASNFHRRIHSHDETHYNKQRATQLHHMRHGERSVYYHDVEQDRPRDCERTNWRSSVYMNCNDFHEINVPHDDIYDKRFLGGGYYRYAWLLKPHYASIPMDSFVLKMLQLPSDDDDKDHIPSSSSFFKIHHEAIIMERLSASPTIVDIYGHCATSIAAQIMPEEVTTKIVPLPGYMTQKQLDAQPTLCQNNLTLDEKLEIALTMAESMAEMHGFVGGVMVHGDIHPDQYLRDANGQVRLNDFNNAEILDWNVTNNQRYCKTDRGAWGGMYRAPEEFRGDYIDEQIDVFALGNNLYTLLTGLWPFYEHESYSVVQRKLHAKERPFIDDSYRHGHVVEQRFVHLMERCWEHTPEDRPSVFQVLDALRRLKETYSRMKSVAT